MLKKWLKRAILYSVFSFFAYGIYECLLIDYLSEQRFLRDQKAMVTNYLQHRQIFLEIKETAIDYPDFRLTTKTDKAVLLEFDLKKDFSPPNYTQLDSYLLLDQSASLSPGPLDTLLDGKKWLVSIKNAETDTAFYNTFNFFRKSASQFDQLHQWIGQLNCLGISNRKDFGVRIIYKESFNQRLGYFCSYLNDPIEYDYLGGKIDEDYSWELFDKTGLICLSQSYWVPPSSFWNEGEDFQ